MAEQTQLDIQPPVKQEQTPDQSNGRDSGNFGGQRRGRGGSRFSSGPRGGGNQNVRLFYKHRHFYYISFKTSDLPMNIFNIAHVGQINVCWI